MKVLWLSHLVPYPPKGGVLQRSFHLLRELAREHEVHLLAFHQAGLMGPLVSDMEEGLREAREVLSEFCESVEFFEIPSERSGAGRLWLAGRSLFGNAPYNIRWLYSDEFRGAVERAREEIRPELVHYDTISLVSYFDALADLPSVLDHHNVESHLLSRRVANETNLLKKLYFWQEGRRLEAWERRFCPRASLNITCSEIDADRLRALAPGIEAHAVPNPVDVDYFRADPESKPDSNRLVFVGTLSWYPNRSAVLFLAEKLWPELKRRIPGISVDIVGANPPERLRALAREDESFRVHGFVDDIRPILDGASLYVCPISEGGGTRLKLLDAFAMGKVVVSHPIACEGIDARDGQEVVFAETPDEYLEAIELLLADSDRRERIGAGARALVERLYSTRAVGTKLSRLYQGCISDRGGVTS